MQRIRADHGGDIQSYEERYGCRQYLDFSANINPLGMPDSVRRALEESWRPGERYPDPHCRELRRALAEWEDVPAGEILCGNGAADLLYRIVYALRPKRALLPAPTFVEYEQALRQVDCACMFYPLQREHSFQLREDFLPQIEGADIVFLCNPNNPTGTLEQGDFLQRVLQSCKQTKAVLVVDECFLDFANEGYSMKRHLRDYNKLIVLKAFTKLFAIPGIRLGYCLCGDDALLEQIGLAGAPWSVSVPAQLCGIAAAKEWAFAQQSRNLVSAWRQSLQQQLQALGLTVFPGAANYLFFHSDVADLKEQLGGRGIMLRDCSNYRGLSPGYYRTAVRREEENAVFLRELGQVLL